MALTWKKTVSPELARISARRWGATVDHHISDSGNSVWLIPQEDDPLTLRLTDPTYRSLTECRAEIDYVNHLIASDVRVAAPVASKEEVCVEEAMTENERMQSYIDSAEYGNKDISGGVDRFLLDGGLCIPPEEQIAFLVGPTITNFPSRNGQSISSRTL